MISGKTNRFKQLTTTLNESYYSLMNAIDRKTARQNDKVIIQCSFNSNEREAKRKKIRQMEHLTFTYKYVNKISKV